MLHLHALRVRAGSAPKINLKRAAAERWTRNDDVSTFVERDVTNAQTSQIQSNRRSENWPLSDDHLIRIDQRDEQRFPVRDRVAKSNQQVPFRGRRKSLDIKAAGGLGRVRCTFGEMRSEEHTSELQS